MKFAKFWNGIEVSVDKRFFGRSTVSIWGASNDSDAESKSNAESRVRKFKQLIAADKISLKDYEYWNGYIREEIVEEVFSADGRILAVLTRNSYGALVLNTESVFFGDIDVNDRGLISRILEKFGKTRKDKTYYIKQVEDFQKANPTYTIKVYETFAGLRVVIINHLFDSNSSLVDKIFSSLDSDPLYVMLCKHQSCFRARLSPKPWRVGLKRPTSRFPRSLKHEEIEFEKWLYNYKSVSTNFASAQLIIEFGKDKQNPDVERVLSIHDKYSCQAGSKLA
ncbi:MAG: hypothetical protein V7782_01225 [Psychromonas sp.]